MELNVPFVIDETRLDEARTIKPPNHWDFEEWNGAWYPTKPKQLLREHFTLQAYSKEYGVDFKNMKEFDDWMDSTLDSIATTEYTCDICGYMAKSETAVENHKGSRNCRNRAERQRAEEQNKLYLAESERPATCEVCGITYKTKYGLATHLTTKKHLLNIKRQTQPLPTCCAVCDKALDTKIRFRRHMKESRKCHRIAREDLEKREIWEAQHKLFGCKFHLNRINF